MSHRSCSGILVLIFVVIYGRCADGDIPRSEDGFNFLTDSVIRDEGYVFSINDEALEKSVWNEGDSPPCSPKRAKSLAKEWINKNTDVKDSKDFEWQCICIRLVHAQGDIWFWVVEHEYRLKFGQSSGIPQTFSVAVLADGSIPTVKKVKPQKGE